MNEHVPRRPARHLLNWLETESSQWVSSGIVDTETRARILGAYRVDSAPHRGTMALVLMAVLMCGIGVLLVIGYNWNRIGPAVKVTMVMGAVAAAFGGAAVAYHRRHQTLGEVLAFAGTLLFGNAIWLIAQVLHIQGHFPDAFMWFAIGALLAAGLVRSKAIGIGSAILLAAWIAAESSFFPRPIYPFLVLWPGAIWLAYRLRSLVMLRLLAVTAALWIFASTVQPAQGTAWPGAVALAGCAVYAASCWHNRQEDEMAGAWRTSGLFVLLMTMIPLMIRELHRDLTKGLDVGTIAISMTATLVVLSMATRRELSLADRMVVAIAAFTALWTFGIWLGWFTGSPWMETGATLLFSALALLLAVTLIRTAFRSNRTSDLAFGILFGLAFLLVRWTSVLQNLLWSGLLLLVAGGGLLFIARLWLHRDRAALAGRAS